MGEQKLSRLKSFGQEFKQFAMRGNVIDLAVGVIIGGAFNKIVTSVVNDLVMPPIGKLIGNVDFKELVIPLDGSWGITLSEANAAKPPIPVIAYGNFINVLIDFLLVALSVFVLIKVVNVLTKKRAAEEDKKEEEAEPTTKNCPYCITEIPIQATRCPQCTSQLEIAKAEADA